MARPRTVSDQQILEAALACFLEHGPSVSTELIASQIGISSQAIFKRFNSKQDLLIECLRCCETPAWIEIVEQGPDQRPFSDQLFEILESLSSFFAETVRKLELLRWSGIPIQELMSQFEEPPPIRDIRVISKWLQRCHELGLIRKVDFDATALAVLTSMHGPAMLREFLGKAPTGHTQTEYISHHVNLLTYGLTTSSSHFT